MDTLPHKMTAAEWDSIFDEVEQVRAKQGFLMFGQIFDATIRLRGKLYNASAWQAITADPFVEITPLDKQEGE